MEATGEDLNLLHKIRPPRLEDAGLEDCALPPHSIQEAFLKAASAVGSRATAILTGDKEVSDDGCVSDPWPLKSSPSDTVVGVEPEGSPPGPCVVGKGGAFVGDNEAVSDVVVVGEKNESEVEKKDEVVVVGGGDGGDGGVSGGCVDGVKGAEIKDKKDEIEIEDEENGEKMPTLVEGYFFNP